MTNTRMMKWRVKRENKCNSVEHDDVRRSLEVLDSVLAEFDDCLENWDSAVHDLRPPEDDSWFKKEKEINADTNSFISYDSQTTDGSTSHDSGLSFQEQVKVASPPPVPKRSATTKLSDRNSGLFTFSDIHSFDSLSSDSAFQDNGTNLSTNGAINTSLSAKDDDEVFRRNKDNKAKVNFCAKCGSEISIKESTMDKNPEKDPSSSPFLERRKMFEDRMSDKKTISVSPLLERAFTGSSFKTRAGRIKECESEPSSLVFYKTSESDRSEISHSNFASKYSPKATKVDTPRIGLLSLPSNLQHAPNCNCKERLRQLQIKFAETRRLLKANKIRGIDAKPPSFVPPPPPVEVPVKNSRNSSFNTDKHLLNELSDNAGTSDSASYSASNGSLNSESFSSEVSNPSPLPELERSSKRNVSSSDEQNLCTRCSSAEPSLISETIEDIPKLRPTDALKMPYLGLSLCMEEDFSPGIKEILQTSTPRNGPTYSKNKLTTSLSTFSLADNSLGYVSSQSDMEISHSSMKGNKVPVSSIKCSTLPEGMDLHSLPSYYGQDDHSKRKSDQPVYRDRNFNHTTDPQLRNSSNSPMSDTPDKPKKKHFRGFSRKDKDKKKNGDLNMELAGRREIC